MILGRILGGFFVPSSKIAILQKMSFSHHEIDKFKGSSFAKMTKNRQKIDEKSKRIWSGKKKARKLL